MNRHNQHQIAAKKIVNELLLASIHDQHRLSELAEIIKQSGTATSRKLNTLCSLGKIKRELICGIYFYANNEFDFNYNITRVKTGKKEKTQVEVEQVQPVYNETLTKKWV